MDPRPSWRGQIRIAHAAGRLTHGEAWILTTLDDMIGDEKRTGRPGELWASNAHLARVAGIGERTITTTVSKACSLGLMVTVETRDGIRRWRALPVAQLTARAQSKDFLKVQDKHKHARVEDSNVAEPEDAQEAATEPQEPAAVAPLRPEPKPNRYAEKKQMNKVATKILRGLADHPKLAQSQQRNIATVWNNDTIWRPIRNAVGELLDLGLGHALIREIAADAIVYGGEVGGSNDDMVTAIVAALSDYDQCPF